jgi:acylphosphatase
VQGVFYRSRARDAAGSLGLRGWVRNCEDGSVEALAEGSDESVEDFIAWCHDGPSRARVTRIDVREAEPSPDLGDAFSVRR